MQKLIGLGVMVMLLVPVVAWGKVGGGDIVFRPAGVANVLYSHDTHVGNFGLKCRECHPTLFKMADGYGKTTMVDMEKGQSCGACHNGRRAFDVKGNTCVKCHP
jgi:c(7)-type cytochrome triheme protein